MNLASEANHVELLGTRHDVACCLYPDICGLLARQMTHLKAKVMHSDGAKSLVLGTQPMVSV